MGRGGGAEPARLSGLDELKLVGLDHRLERIIEIEDISAAIIARVERMSA